MKTPKIVSTSFVVFASLFAAQLSARASEVLNCTANDQQNESLSVSMNGNQAVFDQDGSSFTLLSDGDAGCFEVYGSYGCGRATTLCVDPQLASGSTQKGPATLTVEGNYGCDGWTSSYSCVSK